MIVRISTEGQYRLPSSLLDRLNEIDNEIVEAVAGNDATTFGRLYSQLISLIRTNGEHIPDAELVGSDIILPPADTTIEEARELFVEDGAIPG
ncbi:MAG: hypothetical protein M0Z94_20720 [Dehalococcoidales bacterium]|nr:hypothetical protein [Dehalococcoidales bacterium]